MADELALLHQTQEPSTPKRKRTMAEDSTVPKFSFQPSDDNDETAEGCQTPRSSMALRFRGLAIDDKSSTATSDTTTNSTATSDATTATSNMVASSSVDDDTNMDKNNMSAMRKRQRLGDAIQKEEALSDIAEVASPVPVPVVPLAVGAKAAARRPSLQRSLPSINRFTKPKVRPAGTPSPPTDADTDSPLESAKTKTQKKNTKKTAPKTRKVVSPPTSPEDSMDDDSDNESAHIVDPLRASLTWHEDEITVYDPDDSDDDGLGFDGVGFKPSPLVAEARAAKRRQQLLEYRRREESEARDRRSRRRAAAAAAEVVVVIGDEARKVRFMDMDACAC